MLGSNLRDYGDAYRHAKETVTVLNTTRTVAAVINTN